MVPSELLSNWPGGEGGPPATIESPKPTNHNRNEKAMIAYRATITINVEDAEAPEVDYLHQKAGEIVDYLSFEGEGVEVAVEVQDGVDA